MHVPEWSKPDMMRHRNIYSYFIQREGERLYGIVKTDQQEYNAALILYGENPSITNPMRIFCASLVKSISKSYCRGLVPKVPRDASCGPTS
jgi:hypothetical protein